MTIGCRDRVVYFLYSNRHARIDKLVHLPACLFFCKESQEKNRQAGIERSRERGDGIVQDFNKTCTFFCVCRKIAVPLHRNGLFLFWKRKGTSHAESKRAKPYIRP